MNALRLRRATRDDCRLYWEWANEPAVRAASFSSALVPWESHVAWFDRRVDAADCLLLLACDEHGEPVAQIRFELDMPNAESAVVSVSVAERCRGKGYGIEALALAADLLFEETCVTRIDAFIRPENAASLRLFEKAGYVRAADAIVKGQSAAHMALARDKRQERSRD